MKNIDISIVVPLFNEEKVFDKLIERFTNVINSVSIKRLANFIIRCTMRINYNDTTNAFKLYKREVIEGVKPILSPI